MNTAPGAGEPEPPAKSATLSDYCQRHGITRVDGLLILQVWKDLAAVDGNLPDPQSPEGACQPPPSIQRLTERAAKHLANTRQVEAERDAIWRHLSGIDLPGPIASRAAARFAAGDHTIGEAISAAIDDHLADLNQTHQRIVRENERLQRRR